ncbi:type II toxin-antitoxin system Phd/YefM family antitoxin [Mycolicibacterium hodleri]|uniref:Antitoxin n=1 Tax=Mycolicibacterium hodleri TaxID=49897 RepID=A0A502E0E4_9MYCO|nr:type II toxin-antitoxin system prevent-host-death family antitoxin [Mycolicibacterium hodleri]TPG29880.1 type II toxin-antitoxin system Phd/YefM family antitoxin [Mycolicibacterium hodleri]
MEAIGVRELRQHASRYLQRVAAGETIEVTDRGRPVARLVPITADPWQDLIDAGEVHQGSGREALSGITPRDYGFSASHALDELRDGER